MTHIEITTGFKKENLVSFGLFEVANRMKELVAKINAQQQLLIHTANAYVRDSKLIHEYRQNDTVELF